MSERPPQDDGTGLPPDGEPVPDDPFLAEDPEAREREARRREREARRRERSARQQQRSAEARAAKPRSGEPAGKRFERAARERLSGLRRPRRQQPDDELAPPPPLPAATPAPTETEPQPPAPGAPAPQPPAPQAPPDTQVQRLGAEPEMQPLPAVPTPVPPDPPPTPEPGEPDTGSAIFDEAPVEIDSDLDLEPVSDPEREPEAVEPTREEPEPEPTHDPRRPGDPRFPGTPGRPSEEPPSEEAAFEPPSEESAFEPLVPMESAPQRFETESRQDPWAHELADDGGRRRGSFLIRLAKRPFLWIGLIVLGVLAWFAISLFQPFAGDPGKKVIVKVEKGSTVGEIADLLDAKGVIPSSTMFEIRATLAGRRSDLLAGTYTLAENTTYSDALDQLTTPVPARTKSITIPEGLSREQMTKLVDKSGVVEGSYAKASDKPAGFDPADYDAPNADTLEGFLFPSTYELKPHATADDLVAKQLDAFKTNFAKVDMSYAKSKNLTAYDVLIIASMIEDEAQLDEDYPVVAEVIYNRLASGEPLGIDATIRYATGNYDQPLLESELQIDSPYNTRVSPGLPPTPIDNPGLASIEAAANPAEGDYLFYETKPGTCYGLDFSKTLEEHNAAIARYEAARAEAGGKNPVEC